MKVSASELMKAVPKAKFPAEPGRKNGEPFKIQIAVLN